MTAPKKPSGYFPFAPLQQLLARQAGLPIHPPDEQRRCEACCNEACLNAALVGRTLGVPATTAQAWVRGDRLIREDKADALACSLGYHPSHIWRDWYDVTAASAYADIERRARRQASLNEGARRRRAEHSRLARLQPTHPVPTHGH